MADFALMQSPDGEQMNVPLDRLEEFETNGWTVIKKNYTVQPAEGEQSPEAAIEEIAKPKKKKKDEADS